MAIRHRMYDWIARKQGEAQAKHFEFIALSIMHGGIWRTLNSPIVTEDEVILVLTECPACPLIYNARSSKIRAGKEASEIANWKEAQKWLWEQQNPEEKNAVEFAMRMKDLEQEARLRDLEQKLIADRKMDYFKQLEQNTINQENIKMIDTIETIETVKEPKRLEQKTANQENNEYIKKLEAKIRDLEQKIIALENE